MMMAKKRKAIQDEKEPPSRRKPKNSESDLDRLSKGDGEKALQPWDCTLCKKRNAPNAASCGVCGRALDSQRDEEYTTEGARKEEYASCSDTEGGPSKHADGSKKSGQNAVQPTWESPKGALRFDMVNQTLVDDVIKNGFERGIGKFLADHGVPATVDVYGIEAGSTDHTEEYYYHTIIRFTMRAGSEWESERALTALELEASLTHCTVTHCNAL